MRKISFEEIGAVVATFYAKENVAAGEVVAMAQDSQVGSCVAGEKFCGVALSKLNGCAGVQVKGFVTVKTQENLAMGKVKLAADGHGGVKADAGGESYLVASVDSAAQTAVICL